MKISAKQFLDYTSDQISKASKEDGEISRKRLLALKEQVDKCTSDEQEIDLEPFKASDDEEVIKFEKAPTKSPKASDDEWPDDLNNLPNE